MDRSDEQENTVLVVNPKLVISTEEEDITPGEDSEFVLSDDQVLETIEGHDISQSSYRLFQRQARPQADSRVALTPVKENALQMSSGKGYFTQVPPPYEEWDVMMMDQNLMGKVGEGQRKAREKLMDRYFPDWRDNERVEPND